MPHCDACDSWVSTDYDRVFAVDGTLSGCQNCQAKNDHGENLI